MTSSELLARARSVAGKGIRYKLGKGGTRAAAPSPANVDGQCDCSGYVAWCLGVSRMTDHPLYKNFNGGWINTDAIVHDALTSTGFFDLLAKPKVGALIVYPSPGAGRVGHVGIITKVENDTVTKVIHCSAGNDRTTGEAVQETPPTVFARPATIFGWFAGLA